jgi:SAM-dependent methyltransferase
MYMAVCPSCGTPLAITSMPSRNNNCIKCNNKWHFSDNVLEWEATSSATIFKSNLKKYLNHIKYIIDPLVSPCLPLSYFSKFRINNYYRRVLNDKSLATKWAQHYFKGLNLPDSPVVLDYGCGRGRNTALLNQLGFNVAGQDISANPWWANLSQSGFQVVSPEYSLLPWKGEAFDLVLDSMVIHYLTEDQLVAYATEVMRVLKPGGYWLLLEANSTSYGASHLLRFYGRLHSLRTMQTLAEKSGFREVDHSYEGFYATAFPRLINFIRKLHGLWIFPIILLGLPT